MMILHRNTDNLGILAENIKLLSNVVTDEKLLEHIYLDLVIYNKDNFVVQLPISLETASKMKSAKQLRKFFSDLEIMLDAAERLQMLEKIDGKKATTYKLTVHKEKTGFSYTLNYFDGRIKSKKYTQKEIWCHPRLMRDYCTDSDE